MSTSSRKKKRKSSRRLNMNRVKLSGSQFGTTTTTTSSIRSLGETIRDMVGAFFRRKV